MRKDSQLLRWFYRLSLNLFPKQYRDEYGEELQDVFGLSLDEAATKGILEVGRLVFRELVSLPMAVFLEYLRECRSARETRNFDSYFNFASGSWMEFLTALLPFFLACALMPLLTYLARVGLASGTPGTGILLAVFGLFLVLLVVGVKMGMPRWSLPYLGFLLAMLSVYLLPALLGGPIFFLLRNLGDQSSLFMDIMWDGIFWYGLLTAMVVLVAISRVSTAFQRFRNDWTQLCFILYGAVPFAVWLTFDEYVGDEPYLLLAFLVLAVGAWFYLHNNDEWKRFGALFAALALAMFIAAAGKVILIPTQSWTHIIDSSRSMSEVKHTLIMWGLLALDMLIPLGVRSLRPSDSSTQVFPQEG